MSDIVKYVFSSTDKVNFLTNTDNLTKFVANFENFANKNESEEERRERLCKIVITIRVLFVLTIFTALYIANSNKLLSDSLFMGLALLCLVMPDVVLVVLIIISIAKGTMNKQSEEFSATSSERPPNYTANLKYSLTSTPDIFN